VRKGLPRLLVLTVGAGVVTFGVLSTMAARYTSEAQLAIVAKTSNPFPDAGKTGSSDSVTPRMDAAAINTQVMALLSKADLLSPEFLAAPDRMFSSDGFHPSAAGYELAAKLVLPVLASALGEWRGGPLPTLPTLSEAAESRRLISRATESANRFLRRHEGNVDSVSRLAPANSSVGPAHK
jgi:hypothetical protein